MTVQIPLFRTGPLSRLITKLRKSMKEQNIEVLTNHFLNGVDINLLKRGTLEEGEWQIHMTLSKRDTSALRVNSYLFYSEEYANVIKEMYKLVDDAAKKLKVDYIYIEEDGNGLLNLEFFEFKKFGDYPGLNYPPHLIGAPSQTFKEKLFYKELTLNLLSKKIDIAESAAKAVDYAKESLDQTFSIEGHYLGEDSVMMPFYYEGFEGRIEVDFEELNKVKLFKGKSYFNAQLVEEVELSEHNYLPEITLKLIHHAVEMQGFIKLTNPPNKHFKDYCAKNSISFISDNLFDCLMTEMEPKEIEITILSCKEPVCMLHENYWFIHLIDRYFIVLPSQEIYAMYHDKENALNEFNRLLIEHEETIFKERLRKINEVNGMIINQLAY